MAVSFRKILHRAAVPLCLLTILSSVRADDAPKGLPDPAEKNGQNLFDYAAPNGGVPKDLAEKVGVDQNLNSRLPLGLHFKDESGKDVALGQYFGKRPVMLCMLQLTCDQVCSAQLGAMASSFNDLKFSVGKEFDVITVSIDPREGPLIAQDAKDERLKEYKRPSAVQGWHFLTGDDKNIKVLAKTLGVRYIWEAGQFIHPDNLVLATPDGRISRYFLQLDYNPQDLRFSIMDASKEQVGSIIDKIALSCFHYNPVEGKYTLQVMALLRVVAFATAAGGLLGIGLMLLMEKKRGKGGDSSQGKTPPGTARLKKA